MKRLLIILVILLGVLKLSAQEDKVLSFPRLHWGFSAGGGTYSYIMKGADLSISNKPSYTGNVFLELKFKKWIGIEVGGAYSLVSSTINIANYSKTYENVKDDEGDVLNLKLGASQINEKLNATLIEIPISLRFEWNPGKWTLYVKPGVAYSIVSSSTYNQEGVYTRTGYYPAYGITFNKLASHGFYSDLYHSQSGNEKLKLKNSINPFIGFGVICPGTSGRFFIEGKYYPGSINFANSATDVKPFDGAGFVSMPTDYKYPSATLLSDKIGFGGIMVQIGFRFR